MIKVILFDCDGIIVKEREKYFSQKLMEDGYNLNNGLIVDFFKNQFLLCETGKADLKEELQKKIGAWGYTGTVDELIKYWFEGEAELVPIVVEYIKNLRSRGIKCFVSTNNEKYRTEYLWNVVGLKGFMDGMFSSAYLGFLKSEIGFWEGVQKLLPNFQKNEIVVWDNKTEMAETAKAFGFNSEQYKTFEDFETKIKSYQK